MFIVSFTTKNQDFDKIKAVLVKIAERHKNETLIHTFVPRLVLPTIGCGPEVCDALDELFPFQQCWYFTEFGRPLRQSMMRFIENHPKRIQAYIIGNAVGSVAEEEKLFHENDKINVVRIYLED